MARARRASDRRENARSNRNSGVPYPSRMDPLDEPEFRKTVEAAAERRAEQKRLVDEAQAASREAREKPVIMQSAPLMIPYEAYHNRTGSVRDLIKQVYYDPVSSQHFEVDEAIGVRRALSRKEVEQRNLTKQMQDVVASRPFRVTQHNGTCAVCARHSCRFGCPQYDGPPPAVPDKRLGVWQRFLIWLFGEPETPPAPLPQHRTFIIARHGFGGHLQREPA